MTPGTAGGAPSRARATLALLALLAAAPIASCMRAGDPADVAGPSSWADSVTIALWSMDDVTGPYARDSGPALLHAANGSETRADFGTIGGARVFTASIESFLYVPYYAALESPEAFTVEAWVFVSAYGDREDTPIAGRWTELAGEQSWLFSIIGRRPTGGSTAFPSPGHHIRLTLRGAPARLMFAIQPDEASLPLSYYSAEEVELRRWTHVAATFDGNLVCLYIDGRLDSQYAFRGRIRPSGAPLLIGNYFDPRRLSDFGGNWRVEQGSDRTPYYAFNGAIDELRLSRVARTQFLGVAGR